MISLVLSVMTFTLIQVPFDRFCNKLGSRHAPHLIRENILSNANTHIESHVFVSCEDFPTNIFAKVFDICKNSQANDSITVVLGGDHSCAIPSVFSSQSTCESKNMTLGVMWVDAHADFNTMQSSVTKNIHGMPVAVLCHHTMKSLTMGVKLDPSQFRYVGVRDVDPVEADRMEKYNMKIATLDEIPQWLETVDKVHVSWDIDSVDPSEISSVNTPVKEGLSCDMIKRLFSAIQKSNKLIALDVVEYNPTYDSEFSDLDTIVDILSCIF